MGYVFQFEKKNREKKEKEKNIKEYIIITKQEAVFAF